MKHLWQRMITKVRSLDPRLKVLIGLLFIALGLLALVTPLTPGSWLVFVGLELLGIRFIAWKKIEAWLIKRKEKRE